MTWTPGQRVVVRNAFNQLHRATVADRGYQTGRLFNKVWVRLHTTGDVMPWPEDDVFANLGHAQRRLIEMTPP